MSISPSFATASSSHSSRSSSTTIVAYIFHGHLLHLHHAPVLPAAGEVPRAPGHCTLVRVRRARSVHGHPEALAVCRRTRRIADLAVPALAVRHARSVPPRASLCLDLRRRLGRACSDWAPHLPTSRLPKGLHFLLGIRERRHHLAAAVQQLPVLRHRDGARLRHLLRAAAARRHAQLGRRAVRRAATRLEPRRSSSAIFVFAAVATPSQDPFTMLRARGPDVPALRCRRADRHDPRPSGRTPRRTLYGDLADDELSSIDDEPART